MLRRMLIASGLLAALSAPLQAQIPLLDIRIGGHMAAPSGDFADAYESGFGAYGRVGVPLGLLKLMGSATYTSFGGKGANEDVDIFTLQAGPHFSPIPLLDLGLEGAWFSESEEFGIAPNISVGFLSFEATASYYTTFKDPKANWIAIGVGFRF